jgi:hypothetical protein
MIRKKKKNPLSIAEISGRLRGFILDSQMNDAHEMSVILGCSAISDEVQEREEEESDKRIEKIAYLLPIMYAHSHALAEGAVELQRSNTSEELKSLPDELWWESRKMMEQVALSALVGSVSQLIDMGLLQVPKEHR